MPGFCGHHRGYGNLCGPCSKSFLKFDIPCFIDQKKSVFMNPFVEFLRSAVDMLLENYSYESVFRLLRCGLLDLQGQDMDRLENYVLGMGIRALENGRRSGCSTTGEKSRRRLWRSTKSENSSWRS
ncbi:MAG: hypothetical protein ACLRMZ_06825 [Blautia marasmi]